MTLDEFLKRRLSHQIDWDTIEKNKDRLKDLGYKTMPLETGIDEDHLSWERGKGEQCKRTIRNNYGDRVPFHFVYIKFYVGIDKKQYALVAGKTNLKNPDFDFRPMGSMDADGTGKDVDYIRANKAKVWLKEMGLMWYTPKVLAVWKDSQSKEESPRFSREENFALSIEADIGGLLGLFSS